MKRIYSFLFVFSVLMITVNAFSSCGSKKEMAKINNEVELQVDKCITKALASPETRTWGEASDSRLSFATSYAEGQARAAMQRKISSAITTATEEFGAGYGKFSADAENGNGGWDEMSKKENTTLQIAQGIVNNMATVETSVYKQKNGFYHVFVCMEYRDGISKLSETIAKKVQQQVSDDDRMKINFEFEKFKKRIEEELKKSQQ